MKSFHNDPKIKETYLRRVVAHRKADEIIKGTYWDNGKGYAVGCTIHSNDHLKYEKELGIPMLLAGLEDGIFESLPNERAKMWPEEFLTAIKVGSDLSEVWPKFAVWLLTDEKYGVIKYAKTEKQKYTIKIINDYYLDFKNRNIKIDSNSSIYSFNDVNADYGSSYTDYAAKEADHTANYIAITADCIANGFIYSANHGAVSAITGNPNAAAHAAYCAVNASVYVVTRNPHVAANAAKEADHTADSAVIKNQVRIAQADKFLELLREAN